MAGRLKGLTDAPRPGAPRKITDQQVELAERRLELLLADPATAPHGGGVLVIDDSGDRKDGVKTAHVGHPVAGPVRQDRQRGGHRHHGVG
jgi:hypothetical protein